MAAAVTLYIGDMCVSRSAAEDGWTRHIRLSLPLLPTSPVRKTLGRATEALAFVSGDRIEIEATECSRPYVFEVDPLARDGVDAVCLFSGGVDSLLGAARLLERGLRLCLVAHYADSRTAATHDWLRIRLAELFPGQVDYRPCYVSRGGTRGTPHFPLREKSERSHRVRSFLFLSAAALYADLYGVDTIFVPENGVIALNIPLDTTRAGSRSTRTAHPYFLPLMADFLSSARGTALRICNPFGLSSKTELVSSAPKWTHELLRDSLSCAKYDTLRWSGAGPERHCGYCLPCIYRRLAFDSAGLDPLEGHYACDAFAELPQLSHTKGQDLRSLAFFLKRYSQSDEATRRAMMFANGPLPTGRLASLFESDSDVSSADLVAMYDRFVPDSIRRLQGKCSPETLAVLGL